MKLKRYFITLILMAAISGIQILVAQTDSVRQSAPPPSENDGALFNQRNPRQAVSRHFYYLRPENYRPEYAATLIPGDFSQEEKVKFATQIRDIFDAVWYDVDTSMVPKNPQYIDSISGKNHYYIYPDKFPQIYLNKTGSKWMYAESTIRNLQTVYRSVIPRSSEWLKSAMPVFGQRRFLGIKAWKYVGILITIGLSYLIYLLVDWLLAFSIRKIVPRLFPNSTLNHSLIPPLAHPLSYLIVILIILHYFMHMLILPIYLGKPLGIILTIVASIFGVLFFYRLVDLLADLFKNLAGRTETTMDDQLVPLVAKAVKLITVVLGVLFVLDNLDVNVTALLAGVSIGGLALALAAQDTVRNFIGSISIFVDRPFTIGDFIVIGDLSGTVMEVGVRSTRIRAADGATISIPNGELANKTITNHSIRTYRRYSTKITVTYDVKPAVMEEFVEKVRQAVIDHPLTRDESVIIQFHEMSSSSLDIFYAAIFEITDYAGWLAARQEIFLSIMKLAEEMNVGFAFPSTSVYIEAMPGETVDGGR